jgi:hypothetical protein
VGLLIAILTLLLVGLVVFVVSAPLRRASGPEPHTPQPDAGADAGQTRASHARDRDELEAAREAKYREIRDAELDFRTGKLSAADYQAINADLRAEAVAILNQLERVRPRDA